MNIPTPVPIISPKLQIPPSRLQLVPRERLLERLNAGIHRKLSLISAPAGYGKTTLLSEWAARCEWRLAWVTLAEGDNDPERFLAYLVSAVQTADARLANLDGILGPRFSLQPMSLEAMLAVLVNELSSVGERLVIVLDDFHVIENEEIFGFLNALLDNLPPNIHLVIATRADPPLRLARLRSKDQLYEITEKDLRFTPQETEDFLVDVMGLSLTTDQVAELEKRTEGWVTGLQLVGLSLKDREQPNELIEALDGTHRYILDYLVEEVFSDLPAWLQSFLLQVSILERLAPGLCDFLVRERIDEASAGVRSKEILEFMDASNLFVVPLDNQRQWYRFHPLFAEFLQDRLERQEAYDLASLHRRAAAWYAEHGLLPEAVQHSFAAGDADQAANLIEAQCKELIGRGELTTLMRWIEALPEEVIKARPQLGLARAWAMIMRQPLAFRDTADQHIALIAEGLGITPQELLSALAEADPDGLRRALLGEFAMLQAFVGREASADQAIILFKAALKALPENEQLLRGFTLAGLASTYARAGSIKLAEEAFAQGAQISLAINSTFGYVACTDWQATMQAEQGQMKLAAANYRQAIQMLTSRVQGPLPLSGHVYVGLASVLLEWNELDSALQNVNLGLRIGVQVSDVDALLGGYVVQARTLLALGKIAEAQVAIQNSEQQARNVKSLDCLHEAQANRANLALATGDVEEAQGWAKARGLLGGDLSKLDQPLQEVEYLSFARLLQATGKYAVALPILNQLLEAQEQMGRRRAAIEVLTLQSLCKRSLGRMDEAVRTLARALLLAEPEGFVRVFIQEGPPMAALLRTAGTQGHSPEYARRLLEIFGEAPSPQEAVLEPLSERELEVLRLMADGLTNAEIAAELVIAHSTVKTHVNRIYAKLGVTTRTQAVSRGRQLQILP